MTDAHDIADDVLEGFEDDRAEQRRRKADAEIRRLTAADPGIDAWIDRADRQRYTLTRTHPRDADGPLPPIKAVTVIFTPEEWQVIERAVLASYGLARR